MECEPNYILSDAQQQALPSEKLISECPPHPLYVTGFSNAPAAILVNVQRGTSGKRAPKWLASVSAVQKQILQVSLPALIRGLLSDRAAVPQEQIKPGVAQGLLTVTIYKFLGRLSVFVNVSGATSCIIKDSM